MSFKLTSKTPFFKDLIFDRSVPDISVYLPPNTNLVNDLQAFTGPSNPVEYGSGQGTLAVSTDNTLTPQDELQEKLNANDEEWKKMSGRARKLKQKMKLYGEETAKYARIKGRYDKEMVRQEFKTIKTKDRVANSVKNVTERVGKRKKEY